jgi:hypothetical protein
MKNAIVAVAALAVSISMSSPLEARGMGRFLGGLLARGAVSTAVHSGTSSSASSATKSYTSDVLTVSQLAQCIKKASTLDEDSDRLEGRRSALSSSTSAVDSSSATIEQQRSTLDRGSKRAVASFNALVDRHNGLVSAAKSQQTEFNAAIELHNVDVNSYNGECAKKYYADDLPEAQKQAGLGG